ncbi:NitT/TauT family transport system substrate-binding protein [Kibdelosporangium banguiense]|uniref:NitT/TauT family transport system substrate-binding protein n=1 Tax=Kibdelosporangium banguiense TaxID=1365924 RepID=A0ABS4TSG6_9PSEU|nr:ABC transporter substrate-binding protein [Kibdelosporangium banguiense]MBP2326885.1 NitT/TauT family transport system substrate-binding protein [Kibdelosporangium banguiense]
MRSRLLTALLSVLGLLVAACGSPPAPAARITLGFSAWPGWLPWQVAQEQGLFARNGIDVELRYFDSYTDSLNALATGAIDANSQTLNDTLVSVSTGVRQTIVLVNDTSTGNDQIIARTGIASVADLKGKKIAVEEGTVDHYLLLLALQRAKLAASDVQLVSTLTDSAASAFAVGHVDAVAAFAPYTTTALSRPGSTSVTSSADFPSSIPDHLVIGSELARTHPDTVQRLVDTWFDTIDWISRNPDAAATIMAGRGGVSPADYRGYGAGTTFLTRDENIKMFAPGDTPQHLTHQARLISDFMRDTGLTETTPSLTGLFDGRFVKTR